MVMMITFGLASAAWSRKGIKVKPAKTRTASARDAIFCQRAFLCATGYSRAFDEEDLLDGQAEGDFLLSWTDVPIVLFAL